MQGTKQIIKRKATALKYHYMWHYASKKLGLILVSEFPKSGGTWLCQMLSDYLELPFPRNRMPLFEKSILHGHQYYNDSFLNPICLIRDGRDVMVSLYHHMYMGHQGLRESAVEIFRSRAPFQNFENIKENMPAFITYIFTNFKLNGQKINWRDFTESFLNKPNVTLVRYEDLLKNTFSEMERVLYAVAGTPLQKDRLEETISRFSFQNQTNRMPGQENKNSFLRKGIAQDWKNHFTPEACEIFKHYAGSTLILLGYESNMDW